MVDLGATCPTPGHVQFRVWAPRCREILVEIVAPRPAAVPLHRTADGYFIGQAFGEAGLCYFLRLDGDRRRPDPASRSLPQGVHGPSEVVDTATFPWTDDEWRSLPLRDMVIYELHVGTFTPEGTFHAIIPRLAALRELGVTTIELMPVASFPGSRNWGYDGVGLFAPQASYGGPAGLQRLVDACHAQGLAVILDVVYNHLGPEGNYLAEFGPYFTDRYTTPWGPAINYDGEGARGVRDFFIANALNWVRDYHVDGLRLDAIHGIFDASPIHILRELNEAVQAAAWELGRLVSVVAESDFNDRRVIDSVERDGYGLTGQWSDDFHHCLHALLTREQNGYYVDFGSHDQLAKAYSEGFVYHGQHSAFRGRAHGTPTRDFPGERFVVCAQNHDQVGNRARGERLGALTDFEGLKLAATAVLFSPFVPLLFMGEEYGDPAPFLFFTDFGDAALQAAVSQGRREESAAFGWQGAVPDPQDLATFARSKLTWGLQGREPHRWLREYYRTLLVLRARYAALRTGGKEHLTARSLEDGTVALLRRDPAGGDAVVLLRFAAEPGVASLWLPSGRWRRLVDSAEERFGGGGALSLADLVMPQGGWARIEAAGRGAVAYLRMDQASVAA